ncbi:MAG: selenocysteine-specific translation elongation factor [Candidatus Acididesulfobacter guangdongensis]|uniref:Selenocysteine-specific elongation factor n=1 Tax=Acididesulfobacter guangdongensis TaxID=2597225 RepID=A0A519BF93_ACIG2|nr:MAG: selenocysteine-specific translation elongation factor [Candidatus Acididesulfobacter guangdongensis]
MHEKKFIIIGTAGHIDHGKTSLIKILTGKDTDRLTEEKKRGISIVLGYADIVLPSGIHAGIVDVPGHAKFIKTMVSGSTGMDMVILLIAADDGIMAQTIEHFNILKILGVNIIIPVLTKIDTVDNNIVIQREKEIVEFYENNGLNINDRNIIKVSSKTKEGINNLIQRLDYFASKLLSSADSGVKLNAKPFLPIDRVFSLKGIGTVVTGTLKYGKFSVNDEIEIMPESIRAKIKSIESHNENIQVAFNSTRTALNIPGVEKQAINTGDVVSLKNSLLPSDKILAKFYYLKSNKKELKNLINITFMTGSLNLFAKIIIIPRHENNKKIMPGEWAYIIIKLDKKISSVAKERFIIRDNSIAGTIGGGIIIDPFMDFKYYISQEKYFEEILSDDVLDNVMGFIRLSGNSADLDNIYKKFYFTYENFTSYINKLKEKGLIITDSKNKFAALKEKYIDLKKTLNENIKLLSEKKLIQKSIQTGISKKELYRLYEKNFHTSILDIALNELIDDKLVVSEEGNIYIAGSVKNTENELSEEYNKLIEKIESIFKSSGNSTPSPDEIEKKININKKLLNFLISTMVKSQKLVKIKFDLYYLKDQIDLIQKELNDFFKINDKLEPKDMKDIANVSRKYAIPLLEYFDGIGFTVKKENYRIKAAK